MRRCLRLSFAAFLVLLLAPAARADMGTPIMWAGFLHLTIGNLLIGIGEAALILFVLHPRTRWIFPKMILANYVSMIVGMLLLQMMFDNLVYARYEFPFAHIARIMAMMTALTFLLTLIIEWPFCFWVFRKDQKRFAKSLKANLIAQCASYALLVPLYFYASYAEVCDKVAADQSILAGLAGQGRIYFLEKDRVHVCSVDLDGKNRSLLPDIELLYGYEKELSFVSSAENKWSLRVLFASNGAVRTLIPDLSGRAAKRESTHSKTFDFRDEGKRDWSVEVRHLGLDGVEVSYREQHQYRFYIDTPYMEWYSRYPTVLPGNFVIFEFYGKIVCLDMNQRKIAYITDGYAPVVLLK